MSDLRFQKLTPTSNVDLNVYEEGFEFIFSNDDIRNIAVSGPYSSTLKKLLFIFHLLILQMKIKITKKKKLRIVKQLLRGKS